MPIFPDDLTWQTHQFCADRAPVATDDCTDGYCCSSFWVDIANGKAYICICPQEGNAIWKEMTAEGGGSVAGFDDVVYVDTGDGNTQMVFCESGVGEIEIVKVDT